MILKSWNEIVSVFGFQDLSKTRSQRQKLVPMLSVMGPVKKLLLMVSSLYVNVLFLHQVILRSLLTLILLYLPFTISASGNRWVWSYGSCGHFDSFGEVWVLGRSGEFWMLNGPLIMAHSNTLCYISCGCPSLKELFILYHLLPMLIALH